MTCQRGECGRCENCATFDENGKAVTKPENPRPYISRCVECGGPIIKPFNFCPRCEEE